MMDHAYLNIVIPVYNEGENIRRTIHEIKERVVTPHKIFIVYDFEEDDTLPVVRALIREDHPIHLVKNRFGAGALNAIKTGFETIEEGVILIVMADLSDDLGRVDEMSGKMREGYDIVCGSRYMPGGKQLGGPWFKGLLSRLAGISLHAFVGIPTHDVTNSFKMYSKEVLDAIEIESNGGFELGMEIVVKAFSRGWKITECPSVWRDRVGGESRFKLLKWLPKYIKWYLFALRNGRRRK